MMEEMLQRGHLAAAYGRRTPIAAGKIDRLMIDPIPEILHTGHVHIKGLTQYGESLASTPEPGSPRPRSRSR